MTYCSFGGNYNGVIEHIIAVEPEDTLQGITRRLAERHGWYGGKVEWFRHEHLGRIENMTMEEMRRLMQDHKDDPRTPGTTAMLQLCTKWRPSGLRSCGDRDRVIEHAFPNVPDACDRGPVCGQKRRVALPRAAHATGTQQGSGTGTRRQCTWAEGLMADMWYR